MNLLKQSILISLLFTTFFGYAQFSRTHYIPPIVASISGGAAQNQFMYISTPTVTDVNVRITPIGGAPIDLIVSNNNPIEFFIGSGNNSQLVVNGNDTAALHNDKGYFIDAEDLVYVSVRLLATPQLFHAGSIVSKGLPGLGTTFRVGAFVNGNPPDAGYLSFVSIMATEDNTQVSISDLAPGVVILNNTPLNVVLNSRESYTIALQANVTVANRDGLIGALVTSDRPIVVNSGSFTGSNGEGQGRDIGIDQIAPVERTGNEYIFVRGNGRNDEENPLIVAHEDNTEVFIDDNTLLVTLDAGEYISIDGANYGTNGNLYVRTSKNVFAYQGIGGAPNEPNQSLFFVPPLNCQTPRIVDNIPFINNIGNIAFNGGVTVVTETGANVTVNGTDILTLGAVRNSVTGNPNFEAYIVQGLSGNVTIESTDQVYVAIFGANGPAAFGGYYSGFAFEPEVSLSDIDVSVGGQCIPNVELGLSSISSFDSFQWFFNNQPIPGATNSTFIPQEPGFYFVVGEIIGCPFSLQSLPIPVSTCPTDIDNDGVNDNIDIDNDNDGILNCTESFGNQSIDLSDSSGGNVPIGNFTYTGAITTQGNIAVIPFAGIVDGNFTTDLPPQSPNQETSVTYQLDFDTELSLRLEYGSTTTLGTGLLTNDEQFVINVPSDKNITVLNPDNQILIDTNFDGIFEENVTEFSSFEIRFRSNGPSLALGTGTFSFSAHLVESFTYTHITESEVSNNQATFRLMTTCVPRDTDGDGIEDALDLDTDNDAIPDIIESQGIDVTLLNTDTNADGLDDVFNINAIEIDSDADAIPDFIDLDSDNDGVYDLEESGSLLPDTNFDGIVDNANTIVGVNGWVDIAETAPDSAIIGFLLADLDIDTLFNYRDSESDGDGCSDVIEAGFSDDNEDNFLGNNPPTVDAFGIVNNAGDGYTTPNPDYITFAPIIIDTQPENLAVCELSDTIISFESTTFTSLQWQVSIDDGVTWVDLTNDAIYSGVTTFELGISDTPLNFDTYQYRVVLQRDGNACGLISDEVILTVHPLPIINSPVELIQCDDDTDGFSAFNLTEVTTEISSNAANETFTYYLTEAEAILGDETSAGFIANPIAFVNRTTGVDVIWARIVSELGCAIVSEVQLRVSVTAIPATFQNVFNVCDDFLDVNGNDNANNDNRDGIATFDFSSVTTLIEASSFFPAGQTPVISYYRNEADALAEINPITDTSNYRNIGFPGTQQIFIRVDSEINNDCLGFGAHVTLNVEALPRANPVTIERQCDGDEDGLFPFDTSQIETQLLNGQSLSNVTIAYFDENNNTLTSPLPNPFLTASQTVRAVVTNNVTSVSDGPCFDETVLEFIVDDTPIANTLSIPPVCDGDDGDDDTDGLHSFDTSTIEDTILNGQTGFEVRYLDGNGVELPSPLPNPFVSATQTITVEVINPVNTACIATTSFDLIVNLLPAFTINSIELICTSDPNSVVTLDPVEEDPNAVFTYEWVDEDGELLSTESTLTVSIPGTYFVTLTNSENCPRTREVFVDFSEIATITLDDIEIVDISDNNTITIDNTNNNLGMGDYEFALDDELGPYQDEPFFDNVSIGFHTIFVRDKRGCGTVSIQVSVIGFPRFFTPNGDGFNDFWQVQGVNGQFQPNTIIYIFDRFGKLLEQISPTSRGWDGTFNGEPLPTSDYWFRVQLQDGREVTEHFTLKR